MKLLNIIPPQYRLLAFGLAWLASLVAVGIWQRHDGATATEAAWQTREASEQTKTAARIQKLQQSARQQEARHAQALMAISAAYQKELTDAEARRKRDIASIRAGTLRLRDPYAPAQPDCGSPPGQTPPAAGGRDGAQGAGLSEEAAEFLYELAGDADNITRQLTACQGVILQDRR